MCQDRKIAFEGRAHLTVRGMKFSEFRELEAKILGYRPMDLASIET